MGLLTLFCQILFGDIDEQTESGSREHSPDFEDYIIPNASVLRETDKAYLVRQGIAEGWVPKSQACITVPGLRVPKWLFEKLPFTGYVANIQHRK